MIGKFLAASAVLCGIALPGTAYADSHLPDLAAGKCVGGVSHMGMVDHCLGEKFPDGTYWIENLWTTPLPLIGAQEYQTNGLHCVVGDYPNFVNPAPPGGCGGAA